MIELNVLFILAILKSRFSLKHPVVSAKDFVPLPPISYPR